MKRYQLTSTLAVLALVGLVFYSMKIFRNNVSQKQRIEELNRTNDSLRKTYEHRADIAEGRILELELANKKKDSILANLSMVDEVIAIEKAIQKEYGDITPNSEKKRKLEEIADELDRNREGGGELSDREMQQKEEEYNKILEEEPALKKSVEIQKELKQVEENRTEVIARVREMELGNEWDKKSYWFKEGYFVTFDGIKIYCKVLDVQTRTAVLEITSERTRRAIKGGGTVKLQPGDILRFGEKQEYAIFYTHIGNAGKNPFKKAMFCQFGKKKV